MPGQRRIFVFNPSGNGNGWWIDFARSQNWTINIEKDLQRAESELNAQRPDVLALNYGLNELQFCSRVRANDNQPTLPIVFYSDRPLTREEKNKSAESRRRRVHERATLIR
jgi:DNA-binding response OmpR family regulator